MARALAVFAAAVAVAVLARPDGAPCAPSTDPLVWGPHAWTMLYHLAYEAEARGWSAADFERKVLSPFAETLPCSLCRAHYARASVEARTPSGLVLARHAEVARRNKARVYAAPMPAAKARARYANAARAYRCHSGVDPARFERALLI